MWLLQQTNRFQPSLDAVPNDVEIIKEIALRISGIKAIKHLNIWAVSTSQNALRVIIVIDENKNTLQIEAIKTEFKDELEQQNVQHTTIKTELYKTGGNNMEY